MRSWLILGAVVFVAVGGLGLSACADGAFLTGGPAEDQVDLGRSDLGSPPVDLGRPDTGADDMGSPDSGPPDLGPPDLGPPDLGPPDLGPPDIGPCNGQPTCCGDGIVQVTEQCEPNAPVGMGRCPVNPASDCNQSGPVMCLEGANCQRHCVVKDLLRAAIQTCP